MDHKHGQRLHLERWPQRKDIKNYRHNVSKFFHTQKQPLLTSSLLIVAVLLLFGIFSTFLPPPTNTPPKGVTKINYSTFISQVKTGNVLAVIIQNNEIHALLAHPLVANDTTPNAVPATKSSHSYTADIAAWNRYIISEYPSPPQARANNSFQSQKTLSPSIDPARAIYTHFPSSSGAHLIRLLLSNHVLVSIHPPATPAPWSGLLLKNLLLIFFFLILLGVITSNNSMSSYHSKNGSATQMLKDRAHRFEHAKEKKEPQRKSAITIDVDRNTNPSQQPSVAFADVAGIDEARIELEEIVQFLRSPERFERLGARIPRGALLVGPPGTGKTLLAKAVAGEAGVPFFSISASEFVEMFVGIGASRVRTLFKQARQSAPCVIFIDELDAVGRKRSVSLIDNDEHDQTLNQLLVELDGFDDRKAVIVLGATNRVDMLDTALLRPGRFDRQITVSLPDRIGREAILKVHTRSTPLHQDVSLQRIARFTTGMSGADLANLVNEAALSAARQNLEQLTPASFEEALSRIQLGILRPLMMSETDRRIIAIHESGHALVAYHLPEADTVNRITILPRGQTLGVTQFTSEEDRYNLSRAALMARIAVGLGGRIAEELAFGPARVTTGAENDFQVVTDLARRMVTRWGMSEHIGIIFADYKHGESNLNIHHTNKNAIHPQTRSLAIDNTGQLSPHDTVPPPIGNYNAIVYGRGPGLYPQSCTRPGSPHNNSTTLATVIDLEVQRILNEAHAIAHTLLSKHYAQLTKLAEALLEYEQLDHEQFEALLNTNV